MGYTRHKINGVKINEGDTLTLTYQTAERITNYYTGKELGWTEWKDVKETGVVKWGELDFDDGGNYFIVDCFVCFNLPLLTVLEEYEHRRYGETKGDYGETKYKNYILERA